MKASEVLMNEHRAVERVLKVLERSANQVDAGEAVPASIFEDSLDFLRNFADKCHHGKEETALFPAMEKVGIPMEQGPIAVMLAEHEQGRSYIKTMGEALEGYKRGDPAARARLAESARRYAALLTQHIKKEDTVLFPMADRLLSDATQRDLVAEFDRIESEHIGPGVHEHYHHMIDELDSAG